MENRTALVVALVSGGLAVAIVAVDYQFGLDVDLEHYDGAEWATVGTDRYGPYGCTGPELRLVVDNDWLWGTEVDVHIAYWAAGGQGQTILLDDNWSLDAWGSRTHEFTIPTSAFAYNDGGTVRSAPVNVDIRVGGEYSSVCVQLDEGQGFAKEAAA